ncbi:MAG: transposase [Clostridia bacterium]|nr:transposase [Clostridia bacterium]
MAKVAAYLDIKPTTLHGWIKNYRKGSITPFPGSGKLTAEDERIRKLERENHELKKQEYYCIAIECPSTAPTITKV